MPRPSRGFVDLCEWEELGVWPSTFADTIVLGDFGVCRNSLSAEGDVGGDVSKGILIGVWLRDTGVPEREPI
jgi:hypothetical protein